MQQKVNTVRLTEAQLHNIIMESVQNTLNEGRFGDLAKKGGKGLAKGIAGAGLAAAALYCADKGAEANFQHSQNLNRQAAEMSHDTEYEDEHYGDNIPKDSIDFEDAQHNMMGESRHMDKLIESAIRRSMKKILG